MSTTTPPITTRVPVTSVATTTTATTATLATISRSTSTTTTPTTTTVPATNNYYSYYFNPGYSFIIKVNNHDLDYNNTARNNWGYIEIYVITNVLLNGNVMLNIITRVVNEMMDDI